MADKQTDQNSMFPITLKQFPADFPFEGMTECMARMEGDVEDPAAFCAAWYYDTYGEWPAERAANRKQDDNLSGKQEGPELTGFFVFKNEKKRIAYAAVLVPGEQDSDGEVLSAEKVEHAAHEWLEGYGNVDLMHSLNNVATPVESYILPVDLEVVIMGEKTILPQGSWILGSRVNDQTTWAKVEKGELNGYSVMGVRRAALKELSAAKSEQDALTVGLKKTLLSDLGPNWVPVAVSIVDNPAVPKAKFFALKSAKKDGLLTKALKQLGLGSVSQKEGRRFSDMTYRQMKEAVQALTALLEEAEKERQGKGKKDQEGGHDLDSSTKQADITTELEELANEAENRKEGGVKMNEEQVKELVKSELDAGLKTVEEKLAGIEESLKAQTDETPDEEETEEKKDELEALKSELTSRIEALEEQKGKTSSKALTGQDGLEEENKKKAMFTGRDIYGRKRKEVK